MKVSGSYLICDNRTAGVQGEANAAALRIEFDAGWDGMVKTVTFWNAKGENEVKRILTADLLEDIVESGRIYLTPLPGEAMTAAGKCRFAVDGYIRGKRQRSLYGELVVKPSGRGGDSAVEEPTPTQTEQLQTQLDTLMDDLREQAVLAADSAAAAEESQQSAAVSAQAAGESRAAAADSAQSAAENNANAEASAQAAAGSAMSAKVNAASAAQSENRATAAANRAQAEAERASVPAVQGVYHVILTDRITAERYALMVENGCLLLLGVSSTLDAAELTLVDSAAGKAYALEVESGRLILKEV